MGFSRKIAVTFYTDSGSKLETARIESVQKVVFREEVDILSFRVGPIESFFWRSRQHENWSIYFCGFCYIVGVFDTKLN